MEGNPHLQWVPERDGPGSLCGEKTPLHRGENGGFYRIFSKSFKDITENGASGVKRTRKILGQNGPCCHLQRGPMCTSGVQFKMDAMESTGHTKVEFSPFRVGF